MLGNDKSNLKKWPNGTAVPWFPDIANIKDLFIYQYIEKGNQNVTGKYINIIYNQ